MLNVQVRILQNGKAWPLSEELTREYPVSIEPLADRLVLVGKIPSARLGSGAYRLEVIARDRVSATQASTGIDFSVE